MLRWEEFGVPIRAIRLTTDTESGQSNSIMLWRFYIHNWIDVCGVMVLRKYRVKKNLAISNIENVLDDGSTIVQLKPPLVNLQPAGDYLAPNISQLFRRRFAQSSSMMERTCFVRRQDNSRFVSSNLKLEIFGQFTL
uniref:AlNc14C105G6176 protein n=1 Tax=Albugo laibachii Nc14 TaxID=890382 RepID=F0WHX0_9STRA|nr:AlNc14C105G6176 [Albugo laibachii Nc14]|eukprot:CCA20846.1 AlNc14C105G6176 [Albugo laibachii Nc14]